MRCLVRLRDELSSRGVMLAEGDGRDVYDRLGIRGVEVPCWGLVGSWILVLG